MTDKVQKNLKSGIKIKTKEQYDYYSNCLKNMVYKPLYPDWFYSDIDIPNIELIREEIKNLIKNFSNVAYATNASYSNINVEYVYKSCPLLQNYLISVGIEKKFCRILISRKVILNDIFKVHIDAYNPQYAQHSINIGIADYEDSYTAWFKTDKVKLIDALRDGLNPEANYGWLPTNEATEVKRVKWSKKPLIVNTTILHRGISDKESRIIAGLRFYPELNKEDLIRMGIKNPYIQET
jgi:translation initiation factor 2 beta subunit (eIF-2beta)/eIF-5